MKLAGGYALHFGRHGAVDAYIAESSSHQPAREGHELGRVLQLLGARRDASQKAESLVLHNVHSVVVRPQVVHLLLVYKHPEVGAYKLHSLQLVLKTRNFTGEPLNQAVAGGEAYILQSGQVVLLIGGTKSKSVV